jgi:hypothetical protein
MAAVILRDLQSCFSLGTGVAKGKRLESGLMVTQPVRYLGGTNIKKNG